MFLKPTIIIGVVLLLIITYVILSLKIKQRRIKRAKDKAGIEGEHSLAFWLKRIVKRHDGVLLKNVVLPLYDKTTEIDLIVIAPEGVVIIENKHYSGTIKGKADERYWVQDKQGSRRRKFYNPIMQNQGHIKCLIHHLKKAGIKDIWIDNIVTFSCENGVLRVRDHRVMSLLNTQKWFEKGFFRRRKRIEHKKVINVIKQSADDYEMVR